jgi:D-alanyl-lipoteichoic acid acyltransferase DltB (MBOAT superfamily)
MLFNTPEFIFLFLPIAVVLHFTLARWSEEAAVAGTVLSSLVFYAWWNPPFVLLPILSILGNFWLARRMLAADAAASRRIMIVGIAANVLVLCYYKYADFFLSIVHGTKAAPPNVPLALSFTTFVQIAFLVHVHQRRIPLDVGRYALFVAFFPHLIAGPIVRWGNLGRQLCESSRYRLDWDNIALGLTIFILGLAKKVLLADPLSPHVATVFDAAARGEPVTALGAWGGAVAFSLQIYFDFSGYSDMAVGLGLLFNFRLPINFAAPLRAVNMFDLWRRWHITLGRMARDLVYVPLCLGGAGTLRRSASLLFTMVLIGFWHGAGWTFIVWGAVHGVMLLVNQGWRSLRGPGRGTRAGRLVGWFLTFTGFAVAVVFFRAADMEAAWRLVAAMAGLGEAVVPDRLTLEWDRWVIQHGYVSEALVRIWFGSTWTVAATLWTALAFAVAMLVPDTMEITGYREGDAQSNWRRPVGVLAWRPSPLALGLSAALFVAVFANIGRVSEFLYYQF